MPNSGDVVYPSIDTELHLWQQMSIGGYFLMVSTLRYAQRNIAGRK